MKAISSLNPIYVLIFSIIYIFLYYLNFTGLLFPNDGVYYVAVADHFINFFEFKDPIYDPPRKLLTPHLSQILLISLFKLISGNFWIVLYCIFQIFLFILSFFLVRKYFFLGKNKNQKTLFFFFLILILPIFLRNFTNFHNEGIYFPLFLIFISLSWHILFEKSSIKLNAIIVFLGIFLVFFRVQFLVEILPFAIMAIFYGFRKNIHFIGSLFIIALLSSIIYYWCVYDLILSDVQVRVLADFKSFPSNFFLELLDFLTFPFFHEKFFSKTDFIILKLLLSLFFIFCISYFQKKFKILPLEHFLFFLISIFVNLIFLSFLNFDSQRYFLIPYTFLAIFLAHLFVKERINIPKSGYFLIFGIFFAFSSTFSYLNFSKVDENKSFHYLRASDFIKNNKLDENLACDEPRIYYWFSGKACQNIVSNPKDFKSGVYKQVSSDEILLLGKESFIEMYSREIEHKESQKLFQSSGFLIVKLIINN